MDYSFSIWIILLPLLSFLLLGLFGSRFKPLVSGIIGTLVLGVITLMSYFTAWHYFFTDGKVDGVYQTIIAYNRVWLTLTESLHIDLGVLLDPISVMMLMVVSTISLMVHIYSLGYMKGEEGFSRYYSFLSLFTFSMLGLVVATNLFQMYIFWELVGASSYLLIGFYYKKPAAVAASKKAFIVTRFADLGFLIGILILSYFTGTFDFADLTNPSGQMLGGMLGNSFLGLSILSWSMVLIYMGGAGKSAMFPLHIWLPDAMEGPTPVSALIHAATMVVAGVYLVARMFPVYALWAPDSLAIVAFVGAFTSLFAAIIACTQTDIKRILAYSTISQIGYMMLALGVSGYSGEANSGFTASMFHLTTHAMFKALLFLGAGSIIHAVHSNEMGDMGNLKKYMPLTAITFLVACLAISGIPPCSGFFSKDEILSAAYQSQPIYVWLEWFVAGVTAFYMFRLYFAVFWGKKTQYKHTPHEAPFSMTIPLILLAIGAASAGFIPFGDYVSADGIAHEAQFHWNIAWLSILIALAGIGLAAWLYLKESGRPAKVANHIKGFYTAAYHKFYFDELYLLVTKKIIFGLISRPLAWFDRHIVDGFMNLIAKMTYELAVAVKRFQSGQIQQYAFVFISGAVVLALIILIWWV